MELERRRTTRHVARLSIAAVMLVACNSSEKDLFKPHTVLSQPEAGLITLSEAVAVPWEDYISRLTTNFQLNEAQALEAVIPRTAILEDKILDSFAAGAQIGLRQRSESRTTTTTEGAEGVSSTAERTDSSQPGVVPGAAPAAPGADRGASGLPGTPEGERKAENIQKVDAILAYTAASALFQEVQLLNRSVIDAALRRNMRPYVVRLQVGVQPFARNQPYDVFMNLGFFPPTQQVKSEDGKVIEKIRGNGVAVVPLLVTDNLEGALRSSAVDNIRQLTLALSFLLPAAGGSVNLSKLREELRSVLATDINSLLTVGRVTENTISVRLGAAQQATARHAMLPRTHNISLVIMVPEEVFIENDEAAKKVRVVAESVMRSVETGVALPQRGRGESISLVREVLVSQFSEDELPSVDGKFGDTICKLRKGQVLNCEREVIRSLLLNVFQNNFKEFSETLAATDWLRGSGQSLWIKIAETTHGNEFTATEIDLAAGRTSKAPLDTQAVFLTDDGKSLMTARLIGGHGLTPANLRGSLKLGIEKSEPIVLAAQAITMGSGDGDPILTFPSAAKWKIGPLDKSGNRLMGAEITLEEVTRYPWQQGRLECQPNCNYASVFYKIFDQKPEPAIKVSSAVKTINVRADAMETARIRVEFVKDANKKPLAAGAELEVKNADVISVVSDTEPALKHVVGKFKVKNQDATLVITLDNLNPDPKFPVEIIPKALNSAGKAFGEEHPKLQFAITNLGQPAKK